MPKEEQPVEETADEKQPAGAEEEPRTYEWVRYVGSADERVISEQDWAAAGVGREEESERPAAVRWDANNGYRVSRNKLSFLSDEQFDRLIRMDRGFVTETSE